MTVTSTTARTPGSPGKSPAVRDSEPTDARLRGHLRLDKRVIEQIASQAASESSATGGTSGGLLGIGAHSDLDARPAVSAEIVGRTATLAIELAVTYPTPIGAATDDVREHVVKRVADLAGVDVTRVDITVTALHRAAAPTRQVL